MGFSLVRFLDGTADLQETIQDLARCELETPTLAVLQDVHRVVEPLKLVVQGIVELLGEHIRRLYVCVCVCTADKA